MNSPRESEKADAFSGWEIRRDGKMYSIASNDLLLKIHREGRFSGQDQIRRKGELLWLAVSSVDFQALPRDVVVPIQKNPASKQTPTQPATAAPLSSVSPQQSAAKPATPNQAQPQNAWWKEDRSSQNFSVSRSKRIPIWALGMVGLATVGVTFGYFLWRSSQQPKSQARIAQAAQAELPAETSQPSEPLPDAPTSMDGEPAESNQEFAINTGEQADEAVASNQGGASIDTRELTKTENAEPSNSLEQPKPETISPAKPAESLGPVDTGEAVTAESKEPIVARTPAMVGDKDVITVEQELSASSVLEKKAYADKVYDLIDAKLNFYKKTNDNIQASRIAGKEAKKKVEFLVSSLKENKLAYIQASTRIAELNASLASPAGVISQLQQKINQEKLERSQLTILAQRLALDSDNKTRQLDSEKRTIVQSETDFVETCIKEKESLDGMLQSIDFFQEMPVEVHERILEQAQNWIASEPDFYVAYLLHSAASIWTHDYPIPARNLMEMRRQSALLSTVERDARKQALQRFETIAIGLVGVSEFQQKKASDAIETLQAAFKLDQSFAEIWLVRGQAGLQRKGQADGNYYFKKALTIKREDPRVYRIVLDSLLQQSDFSKSLVSNFLHELVKRAVYSDDRSWLTAADAAERVGELDNAREYLSRVKEPYLQERKTQILSRIEK